MDIFVKTLVKILPQIKGFGKLKHTEGPNLSAPQYVT